MEKKIPRNWIPVSDFLQHVISLYSFCSNIVVFICLYLKISDAKSIHGINIFDSYCVNHYDYAKIDVCDRHWANTLKLAFKWTCLINLSMGRFIQFETKYEFP